MIFGVGVNGIDPARHMGSSSLPAARKPKGRSRRETRFCSPDAPAPTPQQHKPKRSRDGNVSPGTTKPDLREQTRLLTTFPFHTRERGCHQW